MYIHGPFNLLQADLGMVEAPIFGPGRDLFAQSPPAGCKLNGGRRHLWLFSQGLSSALSDLPARLDLRCKIHAGTPLAVCT
jgi:hypothetical protein